MDFIIKKLGWENAAKLHKSAANIYKDFIAGKKQAIVVSAMREPEFNTTDKLILLWEELKKEKIDKELVLKIILKIKDFHLKLLNQDLLCSKEKLIELVEKLFEEFKENILFFIKEKELNKNILNPTKKNDYSIELQNKQKLSIIGFWEKISAKIISWVVDSMSLYWVCSKSVDLWNIVSQKEIKNKTKKEVFDMLAEKISDIILEKTKWWNIAILSGYIWSFPEGIEERIWRWYSDATAAISAVGLARRGLEVAIEIQKSVRWVLSADPRVLDNPESAQVIKKLSYLTAREITGDTGAQAKLLHPQALRSEVQEAGIKIHLFDPFSEEDGTWIVDEYIEKHKKCSWINFIWWRKNVIFFSISSGKMFEKWILAKLFNIVKKYFSVDIVSASETEISFTIDGNKKSEKKLKEMIKEIKKEFILPDYSKSEFIEYKKNKALLFCVGEHMKNYIWLMAKVVNILWKNNINLEVVSQGRLQRAIIFWIEEKDLNKAINLLHNEFIVWKNII